MALILLEGTKPLSVFDSSPTISLDSNNGSGSVSLFSSSSFFFSFSRSLIASSSVMLSPAPSPPFCSHFCPFHFVLRVVF